jgi:TetR/AcrR family transcriptional repressor of nem operon
MVWYNRVMPKDGTATRTRILDAAEQLMERNGVAGTSVDQILAAAKTSKGAFFHHFESKRDLTTVLMERFERWAAELVSEDSACLYIAALSERDLLEGPVRDAVLRAIVTWRDEVAALLAPALATRAGQVPDLPDAHELADHLFATFEGGYLLCRSLGSPEPMRAQLRVFRQLLEALLATS